MSVFKKIPTSLASAVPAAVNAGSIAQVDSSGSQAGWGTAEYGGGPTPAYPVPGPSTSSTVTSPSPVLPAGTGRLANYSRAGAWGRNAGPGLQGTPELAFRGDGAPQGAAEGMAPALAEVEGMWTDATSYTTNDIRSYDVDNHGWVQLVPNDRDATWQTFGHSNAANKTTWMRSSENVARAPLANTGTDYASYDNTGLGGFQIGDGSRVPGWVPQGGNVLYEPPGPANTVSATAVPQATYDPGSEYV